MEGNCTIKGVGGVYTLDSLNFNYPQNNLHLQRVHTGPDTRTTATGDETNLAGTDGAVSNSDWETTFATRGPGVNQFWWFYTGSIIRGEALGIWFGRRADATTQAGFYAGFVGKFANKSDGTGAPLGTLLGVGVSLDLNNQNTANFGLNTWGSSLWGSAGTPDTGITTQPANTPGATVVVLDTVQNSSRTRIRQGLDVNTILSSPRNQTV